MSSRTDATFERYAIFQTGGKQYQALEQKTVAVEKIDAKEGAKVTFNDVLLRKVDGNLEIGKPFLSKPVTATIVKHDKGPKLIAFKFKRRKKSRRKIGHRQPITIVRIDSF